MSIRQLGHGDEDLVRDILGRFKDHPAADPAGFLSDPGTVLLVAEEGATPVGWLYAYELIGPEGQGMMFIYEVDVEESWQGRGFGRALIETVLAEARSRGHRKMWVLADKDNPAATRLYEGAGGRGLPQTMFTWDLQASTVARP